MHEYPADYEDFYDEISILARNYEENSMEEDETDVDVHAGFAIDDRVIIEDATRTSIIGKSATIKKLDSDDDVSPFLVHVDGEHEDIRRWVRKVRRVNNRPFAVGNRVIVTEFPSENTPRAQKISNNVVTLTEIDLDDSLLKYRVTDSDGTQLWVTNVRHADDSTVSLDTGSPAVTGSSEDPELDAFKRRVRDVALKYGREHNMYDVLDAALAELDLPGRELDHAMILRITKPGTDLRNAAYKAAQVISAWSMHDIMDHLELEN